MAPRTARTAALHPHRCMRRLSSCSVTILNALCSEAERDSETDTAEGATCQPRPVISALGHTRGFTSHPMSEATSTQPWLAACT
eukprot:5252094-Amphidinium_carterae.2